MTLCLGEDPLTASETIPLNQQGARPIRRAPCRIRATTLRPKDARNLSRAIARRTFRAGASGNLVGTYRRSTKHVMVTLKRLRRT